MFLKLRKAWRAGLEPSHSKNGGKIQIKKAPFRLSTIKYCHFSAFQKLFSESVVLSDGTLVTVAERTVIG